MENHKIFQDLPENMKMALLEMVKKTIEKKVKIKVKAKLEKVN